MSTATDLEAQAGHAPESPGKLKRSELYVTYAGNYTRTYRALASGVILLLWLNYSAFALLFGAELNAELDRQADIRAAGGERAGLVKLARRGA